MGGRMTRLSIVVPVLNEARIIEASLERLARVCRDAGPEAAWDVAVCDAGSRDGTVELARRLCRRHGWTLVEANLRQPSIARTIRAGLAGRSGEQVLILPCDCALDAAALAQWREAAAHGAACGGFDKRYLSPSWLMRFYAFLQNAVLLRRGRQLVWTNGMFFRQELAAELGDLGFLDDVVFSDFLARQEGWKALVGPIGVSARRYEPRPLRRIVVNGLILAAYRAGLADAATLRRIYLTGSLFAKGENNEERLGDAGAVRSDVRRRGNLRGSGLGYGDDAADAGRDDGSGAEPRAARRHEVRR